MDRDSPAHPGFLPDVRVHKTYEIANQKSIRGVEVVAEKVSFIQTRTKEHQSHLEEEVSVELAM